jgi:hypothetical protein
VNSEKNNPKEPIAENINVPLLRFAYAIRAISHDSGKLQTSLNVNTSHGEEMCELLSGLRKTASSLNVNTSHD